MFRQIQKYQLDKNESYTSINSHLLKYRKAKGRGRVKMFPLKDTICNVNNVKNEIQLLLGAQHFAGYLVEFPFLHYCDVL